MTARAFRFGVTNGPVADQASWVGAARRAEELGYATFLVPDTLYTPAPLPALAAAAAVTTSLRVGTWVLCDALRNPRALAWEVATVDRLSDGRFELGLGAGRPAAADDARRLGIAYESAGARIQRLRDSVATIRGLLAGDEPGFPSAAGQVPLMIAASGPRLLSYAAQAADIVALGLPPMTGLDEARGVVERVRAAAGERYEDVELAAGLIAIGDGQHPWLERMGVDPKALSAAGAVTAVSGTARQMADALLRRRDELDVSYVTVPVQAIDEFAPVVELLAGQ